MILSISVSRSFHYLGLRQHSEASSEKVAWRINKLSWQLESKMHIVKLSVNKLRGFLSMQMFKCCYLAMYRKYLHVFILALPLLLTMPNIASALETCYPVKIMPLGDSITSGTSSGVADPAYWEAYRKFLWDKMAVAGLNVDFVGSGNEGWGIPGFDPDNEGHGGITAGQVATQIYQ